MASDLRCCADSPNISAWHRFKFSARPGRPSQQRQCRIRDYPYVFHKMTVLRIIGIYCGIDRPRCFVIKPHGSYFIELEQSPVAPTRICVNTPERRVSRPATDMAGSINGSVKQTNIKKRMYQKPALESRLVIRKLLAFRRPISCPFSPEGRRLG